MFEMTFVEDYATSASLRVEMKMLKSLSGEISILFKQDKSRQEADENEIRTGEHCKWQT